MKIIDAHHHMIPKAVIQKIRDGDSRFQAEIQWRNGQEWIVHQQGYAYPLFQQFYDADAKLRDMGSAQLDAVVLSPAPPMFYYWLKPDETADIAKMVNDGIMELAEQNKGAFEVMATVPMQDTELAIKEMQRVHEEYGISAIELGTSIEGVNLDDQRFLPFFEAADALGMTLFLHPYYVGDKSGLSRYYFTNLIGNPLDTAVAASSLIFGGILDKFKHLNVILAHGGGHLPYQIGRLDKGFEERKESRTCEALPSSYLQRFYFDTLTFYPKSLEFLVKLVGEKRILLGSDYPFDMGTMRPCELVNACDFSKETKQHIYEKNVKRLFNRL